MSNFIDYKHDVMNKIANINPALASKIDFQSRCLTLDQVDEIIKIDRFIQVLVRTNMGRFLTAVQNVRWYCNLIENHYQMVKTTIKEEPAGKYNTDWVRDISIPENRG